MQRIRTELERGDMDAAGRALEHLAEYIRQNPDKMDEYIAGLRSEQNEHILRALALAMAANELPWTDQLANAAIELSKDGSFQQRQHIALHLMSSSPELREDLHTAVLERTREDSDSQVKASAVAVLADWMENIPDHAGKIINDVGDIFKNATDEDVRAFSYQLLALHREKLPLEMQTSLFDRLKSEPDSFHRNFIAAALSAAPEGIRQNALDYVKAQFGAENDQENRQNQLLQIAFLALTDSIPLLKEVSSGTGLVAEDARVYLALLSTGSATPEDLMMQRNNLEEKRNPGAHTCADPRHNH